MYKIWFMTHYFWKKFKNGAFHICTITTLHDVQCSCFTLFFIFLIKNIKKIKNKEMDNKNSSKSRMQRKKQKKNDKREAFYFININTHTMK